MRISAFQIPIQAIGFKQQKKEAMEMRNKTPEFFTDAQRPGGILKGGRLEIGETGQTKKAVR